MAVRKTSRPSKPFPKQPADQRIARIAPAWIKPAVLSLAAILLLGWLATETRDTDAWWHLKTGEYLWQRHRLPVPDPFAWTTYLVTPSYPGEEKVRDFNLTHEWLSQVVLYLAYAAGGFPGLILFRAAMLALFCGGVGLVAWRRSQGFYRSVAAALLAGGIAFRFASDRPFVFGFAFLAATIVALEYRRWLWLLPPMFAVWSNCHGGYFLGWVPLGVYCAEALLRREPVAEQRRLWMVTLASVLASGLNPNGFRALLAIVAYRSSAMQSGLWEWQHTALWPPELFGVVLLVAAAVLLLARSKVRPADWMLFVLFAGAGTWAVRNAILIGFLGPVVLAAYIPWKRAVPRVMELAAVAVLLLVIAFGFARGSMFQLRAATWRYPAGAANFLVQHDIRGRMFNTYELGGYLMWHLWPKQKVFIDGRALSDSLYSDYRQIAEYADAKGGKTVEQLLAQYQIDIILLDGFEYFSGAPRVLAAALSDPSQKEWKLVYSDAQAVLFMRNPPPGVQPLNSLEALSSMEQQCENYVAHDPEHPLCAQGLANLFARIGDTARARRWAMR